MMRFPSAFIAVVALAASMVIADDNPDESKAIEKIELLGGRIMRDHTVPGSPVVGVICFKQDEETKTQRFSDKYLHLLKSFKSLTTLSLHSVVFTDDGLDEVGRLTNLEDLHLCAPITYAGLTKLCGLKNLRSINLANTRVTNAGLQLLAEFPKLNTLSLGAGTNDDGLLEISKLTQLTSLEVWSDAVADDGLKNIHKLKSLKALMLYSPRITDNGLAEIGRLKSLNVLDLPNARITDQGLMELRNLKRLLTLRISKPQVFQLTVLGIAQLKQSIPDLEIDQTDARTDIRAHNPFLPDIQ